MEDLKKGLKAALARHDWMDADRVAALGASYGGYMINWIAGNWPDRFRCLVNHDGNMEEPPGPILRDMKNIIPLILSKTGKRPC